MYPYTVSVYCLRYTKLSVSRTESVGRICGEMLVATEGRPLGKEPGKRQAARCDLSRPTAGVISSSLLWATACLSVLPHSLLPINCILSFRFHPHAACISHLPQTIFSSYMPVTRHPPLSPPPALNTLQTRRNYHVSPTMPRIDRKK